ncbi:OmpP1/FadL family transporter [Rhodovulum sp. FJ3]|uniref:OmpP1/FadL family transporter n=1 Tax=Rhodovulum sp. FJ3 TaxID=3079053 RepID=UPI00293DA9A4|nr:outer membrane protein transport protein [Rhodovulum sp. FJ3]MDV4168076.1 outer membrane protein transport protein [Rhodovulum sp. FJ3]
MQRILGGVALGLLSAQSVYAGGVERSSQSTAILFEEGTYAEFSFGFVSPSVSGVQDGTTTSTGDVAHSFTSPSLGYKTKLSDNIDVALIIDQPLGADITYAGDPAYPLDGSSAVLDSLAVTALIKYRFDNNISVYGGLRNQAGSGDVTVSLGPVNYDLQTTTESDFGYVAGIAWEKPEIAARVALTYNSAINHDFVGTETLFGSTTSTPFETEVPQSVNLEFQTGIAADTLLFGSVRWVDWTEFDVAPAQFVGLLGSPLVSYDEDVFTYNIGIGRRFNENWSGAISLGYEESQGGFTSNLGPTDGFTSLSVGATYTTGNIEITGGARYIWIGDATTQNPLATGTPLGQFEDNSGLAVGFKVAYTF